MSGTRRESSDGMFGKSWKNWIGLKQKEVNGWCLLKWKLKGIDWIRGYGIMGIEIHKLDN